MSAMPQKLRRYWIEGASVAVPFCYFFPINNNALQQLSKSLWGEKYESTPDGDVEG